MSSEGKPCAGAQSQAAQAATAQNSSKQTDALQISYHGIAARMDRLPISNFHRKLLWLLGVGLLSLYVEKVNRKTILIVSFILIAILGYGWSLIPADNVYLVMFVGFLVCMVTYTNSVTISAIYLPEPFPTACRTRGAGIANAFGRIAGVISPIWITALLATSLGATAVYMLNAGIAIFMAIWVAIFAV